MSIINVFQYWGQGFNAMPMFLKIIYKHNVEFCKKNNLNLIFIDDNNVYNYITPHLRFKTLDYNFKPKIVNIEMPSEVMLNDSLWTELEFFVTVFDANNNLDQIKYLINTSNLTNDYEPEISEDIFTSW